MQWLANMTAFLRITFACYLLLPLAATAAEESFRRFGDYEVHYSVFNSTFIPPEVASVHGITRSKTTALMNITLLRKQPDGSSKSVPAIVSGEQYDLIHTEPLAFAEIREPDAIYYLSSFAITHRTTIYFTILVRPDKDAEPFRLQFSKLLYKDE